MKLLTSIYTIDELNTLIDSIDYALINVPNYSLIYKDIDVDLAINILSKNNKGIVLSINKIMQPFDIEKIDKFIDKYKDFNLLFYVSDLGVINLCIKKNIINKVIYNPETMITNYLDLKEYYSLGLNTIGISNEITLNDLIKMNKLVNSKMLYQVFGHRLMFYSKRSLVSLYEKQSNLNIDKSDLYLKEVTRNDYFPIIENNNGTFIYRPYLISLLDKINEINFLEFLYVESLYIDINTFKTVNEIYYDVIKNNGSLDVNLNKLNELKLNINDGFIYKDSVYQKEELKND